MIKKGNHLDDFEPINEQNISKEKLIEILRNKICNRKTLDYIISLVKDYKIYDKTDYSENLVQILKNFKSQKLYEEYI